MNEILDSPDEENGPFNTALFNKYAMILIACMFVHILQNPFLGYVSDVFSSTSQALIATMTSIGFLIGLVVAVIVYQDMTKLNWISWPIIILTVLNYTTGVCLTLAFFVYKKVTSTRSN